MQKGNRLQGKQWNISFFLPVLLVVAADQLSKTWIRSNLAVGQSLFELGFFRITRLPPHTGAAFGLFQGHSLALIIIGSIGAAALLVYALFFYRFFPFLNNRLSNSALGLILGGTVGNLIDRFFFEGVTDFIIIGIWPAFNIADSAIVVGTIIFAYILLRLSRAEKHYNG
jgi:signal peptidase II